MRFWDKIKPRKRAVPSAHELKKGTIEVPFENFLADLKESGKNVLISLKAVGEGGGRNVARKIHIDEVTPSTFEQVAGEVDGPGNKQVTFLDADDGERLMMRKDTPTAPITYQRRIPGEPKQKKKEGEGSEAKSKGLTVNDLVRELISLPQDSPAGALLSLGVKAVREAIEKPRASFETELDKFDKIAGIIEKHRGSDKQTSITVQDIKAVRELENEIIKENRPPVDTENQQPSGFGRDFWREAGPYIGQIASRVFGPQTPEASNAAALPGGTSAPQPEESPAASGPATPAHNGLGIPDPLAELNAMAQRGDPAGRVADKAIQVLDIYASSFLDGVPLVIRGYMERPGQAFDELARHVPALSDAGYREEIKAELVPKLRQWWEAQMEAENGIQSAQDTEPAEEPEAGDHTSSEPGGDEGEEPPSAVN